MLIKSKVSKILGVGTVLVSLVLAGCGTNTSSTAVPIKIGMFGPLSGTMSVAGSHQKDGAQFAVDEINAAGGVLGKKLEIIFDDTEGVPQNAVNIMNKFLYKDNVTVTMGSNNSPEVLAVMDQIKKAQTPHIVPSGVAYAITHSDNPWVFRVTATDEIFSQKLVDYAVKNMGLKKFAILYDTNDYGQGGMKLVTAALKGQGLEPVTVQGYNQGTKDFTPQLLKAKEAQADALLIWGNYTEGAQLVRQINQLRIPGKVLVSTGVTIGNFYELAGDAANGIIGVSPGYNPERKDAQAQDFIKKYQTKMNYVPDLNVVMAYDSVKVFAKAVEDAKSTDKKAIRDALAGIKNYQAISGTVTFNQYGDGGTNALMYTVENRKPKLIQ